MGRALNADAWAAGFIDGEACFDICRAGGEQRPTALVPRFAVGLRADDVGVLCDLRATFGGGIAYRAARGGASPVATWTLASKRDLRRLCDYLDRFPLRSKKARDYLIWREAVAVYEAHGSLAGELHPLRAALKAERVFAPADVVDLRAVAT